MGATGTVGRDAKTEKRGPDKQMRWMGVVVHRVWRSEDVTETYEDDEAEMTTTTESGKVRERPHRICFTGRWKESLKQNQKAVGGEDE